MNKYQKGKIVKCTVSGIESYGIFVTLDDYYTGLIHISEVSHNFVKDLHNFVTIGENIYAEILEVNELENQLSLSIKNIKYKVNKKSKCRVIVESGTGFLPLAKMLPVWIDKKLKKIQKVK